MAAFLSSLIDFIGREQASVKIMVTLLILIFGHLGVKLVRKAARQVLISRYEETNRREMEKHQEALKHTGYLLDAGVVLVALFYLNTGISQTFLAVSVEALPELLSALLVALLGVISIELTTKIGRNFLEAAGLRNYLRQVGLSTSALDLIAGFFKGFLYLLLLQLVLNQIGIGDSFVRELVTASSWAAAFLIAGLLFYGFKDLFQNFAAGVYLKNSRYIRPGEQVNIDGEDSEIRNVSLFSTSLNTREGYTKITPNREIADSSVSVKRTKRDVDTLDEIKNYFVAQHPSYCGPASLEMALEILGYRYDQDRIGEKAGCEIGQGTLVEDMIKTVEELTNNEVSAAWIEHEKITDVADEFKTWFNDGALIIPNFYKPELFPDATTGHYVLSVGVEGNEILIMDPNPDTGGVYYVEKDRLKKAMSEFDHERGYIVLAPEGTTASWRIKNDLLYSDKNYYDDISKTLESRLRKLLRQGRILKDATPKPVDEYLKSWRKEEKITRLWKPEKSMEDDGSEEDNHSGE